MLKRKAKPSATNMYIDDKTNTLITVVAASSTGAHLLISSTPIGITGGGRLIALPRLLLCNTTYLREMNLFPSTELRCAVIEKLYRNGHGNSMLDSIGF